ncbi:hydantoinase B/oxoprolinase family protein [Rhizobium oryzicola]|uniref:Hydantoinase B/oxoprolinase family protein n=1 Tax=Rhizobium oryzicola TaxID=1232668 RepID=A0ABT8SVY7_9HYPH|nr:hydantoinase B/oxoprolinase family protein [Rhizobium oryzicola]MDO1582600.1 hydantoinase B/oxoprolinase family protein [Rhizobium oryzicola]
MKNDTILAEVVRHGLQAVAEEMGAALIRTAHSINIRDRRDFSCGVFDATGQLIAQAEHIPVHLGLIAGVVSRTIENLGEEIAPGTMVVTNDPWLTGSHLPDVVVIAPVDADGRRLGYVANMAHQVDLGGFAPGSLALGTVDITQEGLRVPPMILVRDGDVERSTLALFKLASRTPDMVAGDLLAQAAANTTGARRLAALVERTGVERFDMAVTTLLTTTEKRLENAFRALEGRTGCFSDTLEWHDAGNDMDLTVTVSLTIADGTLHADFTGTSGQVAGPVNAPIFLTASCVLYVVKAMLDPDIPSNAGLFRRILLKTPERSIVSAAAPSPVALCTSITSQRITDALIGAFNQIRPDRPIAASTGSMNALILGGTDPASGRSYSYVETYAGGQGGLPGKAGASGVHCHMTNTANSPVELIEREYPLTVIDYGLIDGSGGTGEFDGGHGLRRTILVNADSVLTVHLDRTRHQPWGVMGGSPACGSRIRISDVDGERSAPGKSTTRVRAGTTITMETAGGGGWGNGIKRV